MRLERMRRQFVGRAANRRKMASLSAAVDFLMDSRAPPQVLDRSASPASSERDVSFAEALLMTALPLSLLRITSLATFALAAACGGGASGDGATAPEGPVPHLADAGVSDGAPSGNPPVVSAASVRSPAVAADVSVAAASNNAFAVALYQQASQAADGQNFLTSPISANLALTMTYAGAEGATASQMAGVLHVPESGPSIFDAQNALSQALDGRAAAALASDQKIAATTGGPAPSPDDYALEVVNSVWGEKGYPWENAFLGVLAQSYGTGVYVEDFAGAPAAAESAINQWVDVATDGKINPLLAPGVIDSDTRMVLVNAIHVKLPWASPFHSAATAPGAFTRGDGSIVQTSFLNQTFETPIGYADTSAATLVFLPLAGNDLSVVIALPKQDLASLTSSLTADSFAAPATHARVDLSLPKFSFTSASFSLSAALQALGMVQAFDASSADFGGMVATPPDGQNLYIADVLQKATLDVAENGVEAAAATAVIVALDSVAMGGPNETVVVDHPFLVSIVDASGAILFLGQIDDPTDSGS
jgi:serpin B